jgi:drug/metabolite transporter (DMT)-like permease
VSAEGAGAGEPSPSSRRAGLGMPAMAASAVLFSLMSFLIPLTHGVSSSVIASARFLTGILAILGIAAVTRTRLVAVNRWWLVLRGVIGSISVYLLYRGIMNLGLGQGTILNYTYPIFAALLAPVMIREKVEWDVLGVGLASFVGIWFVVSPGRFSSISVETLLALLGGVTSGVAVVAIKKLRETETPSVIYLAQCVFGLVVLGWPTAASSFGFAGMEWVILLGIGVVATVAQLAMTWAYKHVRATQGSLMAFLTPVLNFLLGALVFGERMHPATLVGSALVLACCGYIAFRERILRLLG